MNGSDVLLHDIYKYLSHYPIIQVHWEILGVFMVPYKHTIGIERSDLSKSGQFQDKKLKIIQDSIHITLARNNNLQKLFHEVIKNNYLCDLITKNLLPKGEKIIKEQINYNEKDPNELILNDKILTILNELKILYHDNIHKQMEYPLQLWHICAILLYCGKSCN
ncbi:hypothetical protein RFI_40069, partial [Reticulomyxa filosa]